VIKAVICDFGGVLTSPLVRGFLAYQEETGVGAEQLGMAMARSTEEHGEHPLFELERGRISEREFGRRLEQHLEPGFDLARLSQLYFDHLEPNRPMIELMAQLRERGLRVAMLTNNVREWEARWRSLLPELDSIFELVVDSAFVGMRKPEPEIYALTLERLGDVRADECLFVDDLDVNCEAARVAGMKAIRFEDNEQAIPEITRMLDSA
jgi:putative hydrolase of the HAD superfamily